MIATVLAFAFAQAATPDARWARYNNVRFGYSACYPQFLKPSPEAANGDGRQFSDGIATATVYGGYNPSGGSAERQAYTLAAEELTSMPSYTAHGANWGVASGVRASRIIYVKVMKRDDRAISMIVTYPVRLRRRYDTMVSSMEKCLSVGSAPF